MIGSKDLFNVEAFEKAIKEMSTKEVKVVKKNEVKFDFKEKGKKPVVTKDVMNFSITGDGFNMDALGKLLIE